MRFPCDQLPNDPAAARLLGVYPQLPEGLFMQRVKVPGGRITLEQWTTLAELAAEFTSHFPLHITTRQDVQFHGLRPDDIPTVQRRIAAAGLTGAAACGDTVRNITACPEHCDCEDAWDLTNLVVAIQTAVAGLPWSQSLPRKFKISLSGCRKACGRPWLNDIGLVVGQDGLVTAIVAGSLGGKPMLGIEAYRSLPPSEVVPLVVAALRLFNEEGDRENRNRARLRYLRQRLGETVFLERLQQYFDVEKSTGGLPMIELKRTAGNVTPPRRLRLPLGDIAPDRLLALVNAVCRAAGEIRIGLEHDLLVYSAAPLELDPQWSALPSQGALVACPGTTWCTRGVANSRSLALRISAALPADCPLHIAVSGCPNNCSQTVVADVGLIGRMVQSGEGRGEGFRLLAGGGWGQEPRLAVELHPGIIAPKVPEAVAWLANQYQADHRHTSFAEFVATDKERLSRGLTELFSTKPAS